MRPLAVIALLALAACEPPKDYGRCLQIETTIVFMPMIVSSTGVTQMFPMPVTNCARWEFPEGRTEAK